MADNDALVPDELGSRTRHVETSLALVDFVLETSFKNLSGDAIKYLKIFIMDTLCLLYTSPSPRDLSTSRMPSSA